MLLTQTPDIFVYQLCKRPYLEPLGIVEGIKSLAWDTTFSGASNFKLWVLKSKANYDILKLGNIVYANGDAFLIQKMQVESDDGASLMCISGKSIDVIMSMRTLQKTYVASNKNLQDVFYELVKDNFSSSSTNNLLGKSRAFGGTTGLIGTNILSLNYPKVSFQNIGSTVLSLFDKLIDGLDYGWKLKLHNNMSMMNVTVSQVQDRTINSTDPIVLSTDFEDILSSTYSRNISGLKTVAYVFGEGEGSERKHVTVDLTKKLLGDEAGRSMMSELYVDARDLQSTYRSDDGSEKTIPEADYLKMLEARGVSKLLDNAIEESFTVDVRCFGDTQFVLGVDYTLGDRITIVDEVLGLSVDAVLTKVEESISDKYFVQCSFGDSKLSLLDKLNIMIS